MRVQPQPCELFGLAALVDLSVKEVSHRLVIERHVCPGTSLLDELHVLDEQQVVVGSDSESTDFRFAVITQEQQLRPCGRAEAEYRRRCC